MGLTTEKIEIVDFLNNKQNEKIEFLGWNLNPTPKPIQIIFEVIRMSDNPKIQLIEQYLFRGISKI